MPHKKYDQWIEKHYIQIRILNYYDFFFFSGVSFILYPEIFYLITMILQRIRIIVGDAGFESGTSAPEVWCATNEPPHPPIWIHSRAVPQG